jgi:hypothetical protein
MTKGITLIAIGGYGYLKWAVNMAASLKYHSPNVAIQLICSKELHNDACSLSQLFDSFTILEESDYRDEEGRLFPAKIKTNLYKFLEFDETIYLDVDGVIMKDITPLFNQESDLVSDVQGVYDLSQGETFNALKWAKPPQIWFHFGLKPTDKLPAINSSFLFIRKSDLNKKLFELAHELLMSNPLPYENHWYVWGRRRDNKISQPDELYLNVAMAMLGIIPGHEVAIYFRMVTDKLPLLDAQGIREAHYGIGLFGQLESNHRRNRDIYNVEAKECYQAKVSPYFQNYAEVLSQTKFAVI